MNMFDVVVLILVTYGLISGFKKGFIIEVSGMIALGLGITGAFKFSEILGKYLVNYIDWQPKIIQLVSFILLFIGIVYIISLLAKMLTKALKLILLGGINRLLGALFGILKWILILCALTLVFKEVNQILTLMEDSVLETSFSYPIIREMGEFLFNWVKQSETIKNQNII
jgi:membrane protein required for colicin V production